MSKENLTNDMALATVSSASHKTLDRLNSKYVQLLLLIYSDFVVHFDFHTKF